MNNIGVTEKRNKKLRICLDPADLNKAIKRDHHPIPVPDQILVELEGKTLCVSVFRY